MNLWNFLRYAVYRLSKLVNAPCDWPAMKYAHECKLQVCKQLDVKVLLKRIIFIEHCLTHLIEDYQFDALQISKPVLPQEVKNIRLKCQSIINAQEEQVQLSQELTKRQKSNLSEISDDPKNEINFSSPKQLIGNQLSDVKKQIPFSNQINNQSQFTFTPNANGQNETPFTSQKNKNRENNFSMYLVHKKDKNDLKINHLHVVDLKSKRRSSYLSQLQQSAFAGNRVSKKIWNQVEKNIKEINQEQN